MLVDFYKDAQKFSVKKVMEPVRPGEAVVRFQNRQEIQNFFDSVLKIRSNAAPVQQIAKRIAPTFCVSHKSRPQLSSQERIDFLFSELAKGNASVVLKNESLKPKPGKNDSPKDAEDGKNIINNFDIKKIVNNQVAHLKRVYSKIFYKDFSILETVYQYDENSIGVVPAIMDLSSVKEHSTGWTSWDNPFDIAVFGAFKTIATYHVSSFLNLSNKIKATALIGANTELISAKYLVTGKSIIHKRWYGSYAIRFNLNKMGLEVPWVKFRGCGPEERLMVELKRKDRIQFYKTPLYTHPETMVPSFVSMNEFLADYKQGLILPEKDVNKPMMIQ